jgi:hypothetical protein
MDLQHQDPAGQARPGAAERAAGAGHGMGVTRRTAGR